MIHVVVAFWNAGPYIARCLKSIQAQKDSQWRCVAYDDFSPDDGYEVGCQTVASDSRFEMIRNPRKLWMVGNLWQFRRRSDVADEDIVVQVDGDDWLPDDGVLERVRAAYSDGCTWVTYGNYLRVGETTREIGHCRQVASARHIRRLPWTSSALRTFKVFLLRRIRYADLLWKDNGFIPVAGDLALMFPMIEMAGDKRHKCLPEINYCYNVVTPFNDFKIHNALQKEIDLHLRRGEPYEELTGEQDSNSATQSPVDLP